ncbi:MAG: peptide chain release factor N(5)-glutamine methyltransferase [Gammaproteobacteria bacterium]|nr:peptide chain release factor N(5)-glutamine methyltransferase [Gammaproteobacteria bacterium]
MAKTNRVDVLLKNAKDSLSSKHDTAAVDAEILLCHVINKNRSFIYSWPEHTLTQQQQDDYQQLIKQRLSGQPVAYLVGTRDFWSLELNVCADVLIPRPDTERLVELALEKIPVNTKWKIVDLGTGSGAIALAIASERPNCHVYAVDCSPSALEVAKSNAKQLEINNIDFITGNWLEPLFGDQFGIIVSNPPYIAEQDIHLTQGDIRFEPSSALVSGKDGLDDIRLIISSAPLLLKHGGWLLLEHGYNQGDAVRNLFIRENYTHVTTHQDLSGNDRVTLGKPSYITNDSLR